MLNNSRLTLPLISVVTTISILGSYGKALALQRGDNNSEVKNVQSCLKRLGYFNGPVNGNFGSMTEAAVTRFQQANGISAIGKVGPQTRAALQRRCGRNRNQGVSQSDCQRGLRFGCDGAAVRTLQRNLRTVRVYNGPITGRFRGLTRNAVITFQRQEGINPIGVYGPQTQRAMQRALNAPRNRPENRDINPAPINRAPRYRFCDHNTEIISIGCRSEWVRQLQLRLQQLGYFNANSTGNFGELTRSAVVRFQEDNRLPVTGSVNSITWGAIVRATPQTRNNVLGPGSRGPQVSRLQQDLTQLRYFFGRITGDYDRSTEEAVRLFQRDFRLPITGTVDSRTSQAISMALGRRGMGGRKDKDFEPIYFGDRNQRVEKLQRRLLELGLLKSDVTGYFGNFTQQAVTAFQRYQGLADTGFVDEQTWQRLELGNSREKRYVIVIPLRNQEIYNQVLQYQPLAKVEKSRRGNFVNAGEYNQRSEAQRQSLFLRQRGFDARVEYF